MFSASAVIFVGYSREKKTQSAPANTSPPEGKRIVILMSPTSDPAKSASHNSWKLIRRAEGKGQDYTIREKLTRKIVVK